MREWIASLPLRSHAAVLSALLDAVERDERLRFVELCCSVARGTGDELSDLDLGLGVADAAWPDALDVVAPMLRGLSDVVDLLEHQIDQWGSRPHRRFFAQYSTGVQVDLVALPASVRTGLPAGSVALYDPDGRLAQPLAVPTERADADQVREWAFLAWVALADADKYLRRGSAWEAADRVEQARREVWRLAAAGEGVPFPAFGLTSLVDHASPMPAGIDETLVPLDAGKLRDAAIRLARIVRREAERAAAATGSPAPQELARYVTGRLGRE
ncbi:MAG: hypothetical protein M3295_06180 [Chloroflexota bacterium]|nr:hypothetical protein [Chloroflexota bacterium]